MEKLAHIFRLIDKHFRSLPSVFFVCNQIASHLASPSKYQYFDCETARMILWALVGFNFGAELNTAARHVSKKKSVLEEKFSR